MVAITIKQEVEATPEIIEREYEKQIATWPPGPFPAKEGDLIYLEDALLKALGGVPGMPVRVIAASQQSGVAFIAMYNSVSHMVMHSLISSAQIKKTT